MGLGFGLGAAADQAEPTSAEEEEQVVHGLLGCKRTEQGEHGHDDGAERLEQLARGTRRAR